MIRGSLKGYNLDYPDVSKNLIYWFFAHKFGFTPSQVDELPFDTAIYLMELEKEFKKLEKQAMKK